MTHNLQAGLILFLTICMAYGQVLQNKTAGLHPNTLTTPAPQIVTQPERPIAPERPQTGQPPPQESVPSERLLPESPITDPPSVRIPEERQLNFTVLPPVLASTDTLRTEQPPQIFIQPERPIAPERPVTFPPLVMQTQVEETHTMPPPLILIPVRACDYYDINGEIDRFVNTCQSCAGKCGHVLTIEPHINELTSYRGTQACHCDMACVFYYDCCPDFDIACPAIMANARDQFPQAKSYSPFKVVSAKEVNNTHTELLKPNYNCIYAQMDTLQKVHVKMVTQCSGEMCHSVPFDLTFEFDLNVFVHVVDADTGIHYIHTNCALCNGVTNIQYWELVLSCQGKEDVVDSVIEQVVAVKPKTAGRHFNVSSNDELRLINSLAEYCQFSYKNTGGFPIHQCTHARECDCEQCMHAQPLTVAVKRRYSNTQNYANPYCALQRCPNFVEQFFCGVSVSMYDAILVQAPILQGIAQFSLSLLMDFNPREGLHLSLPEIKCAEDEIWVSDENSCRKRACPPLTARHQGICTMFTRLIFNFKLSNLSDSDRNLDISGLPSILENNEKIEGAQGSSSFVFYQPNYGYLQGSYQLFTANDMEMDSAMTFSLLSEGIQDIVGSHVRILVNDYKLEVTNGTDLTAENCTWVKYSYDEVKIDKSNVTTLIVMVNGVPQTPERFFIEADSVSACMVLKNTVVNAWDITKGFVSIIFLSLSMVCLLIRVVLQFSIPSFRLFPGRLQFHTVLAILLFILLQFLTPFLGQYHISCEIVAVLKLFAFLSMFVWMNIIAMNTFATFGYPDRFSTPDEDRSMIKPVLIGWIMPMIYTIVIFILDYTGIPDEWQPKFGLQCWLSEGYPLLVFFVLPVGLSCTFNVIIFSLTCYALRRTFQTSAAAIPNQNRCHVFVYIRLFVLMGLTWIFFAISAVLDNDVLWVITIALCASQGIFIFVSFVCKKKHWKQLKDLYSCSHSEEGFYTDSVRTGSGKTDTSNVVLNSVDFSQAKCG